MINSRQQKIILSVTLVVLFIFGVVPLSIGWLLTHPPRVAVEFPPEFEGIKVESVSFKSRAGGTLQGWFLPAKDSQETIIIAHGYHNNRLQTDVPVAPIARQLQAHGYNVLLFDFRGNGQSEGKLTSLGFYEKDDLKSAVEYLKSKGKIGKHIGVLGFSMGAATSLLAAAEEPRIEVVVADSPFADLQDYLTSNLSVWTYLPDKPFTTIILRFLPKMIDVNPAMVSPLQQIPKIKAPVLLIHGTSDRLIPLGNSEQLYKAAPQDKQLWIVKDATHIGSYKQNPDEYMKRLLSFYEDNF